MKASAEASAHLDSLYANRKAYHGDLHNHSASGGTSDGKCSLETWRREMKEIGVDFAAILDHRQVRHMYLPEWEDGLFIGGTEPGTNITDSGASPAGMHYNMIFENGEPVKKLLESFCEYEFEGGNEGHFIYPDFTYGRIREIIAWIKENGGFFVFPHPTLFMKSENPLDYWLADETGFEIFHKSVNSEESMNNYKVWCSLLQLGKRVWATAGDDMHSHPTTNALTTVYSEERTNRAFISYFREGDFVCGGAGIRMCVGDCKMGGKCSFEGKELIVSTGDFHKSLKCGDKYKLVILNEKGIVATEEISPDDTSYFSYPAENCRFYRAEIFNETKNIRIAIGNPVWNE